MPKRRSTDVFEVKRKKCKIEKYEECFDTFLPYQSIIEFLKKLAQEHPTKVRLATLGETNGGHEIYMVTISDSQDTNKNGILIEAGSNGEAPMTVAVALCLINHLAKNKITALIMDYFIIPCLNPDAYDFILEHQEESKTHSSGSDSDDDDDDDDNDEDNDVDDDDDDGDKNNCSDEQDDESDEENRKENEIQIDVAYNYPFILGLTDFSKIPTDEFIDKIKQFKQNFRGDSKESNSFKHVLRELNYTIKLFISIQANGENICYPYGCYEGSMDESEANKIAQLGQKVFNRPITVGAIHDIYGITYGSIIDFVELFYDTIKFNYILNIHAKDVRPGKEDIENYSSEVIQFVKAMTRAVFMYYNRTQERCDVT